MDDDACVQVKIMSQNHIVKMPAPDRMKKETATAIVTDISSLNISLNIRRRRWW